MKKEMILESNKLEVNFFYDDRSFSKQKVSKLKTWLLYSQKAFEEFLFNKELKNIAKINKIKKYILNVTICGEYKIKKLNQTFRSKNKVTDVLSFPLQDGLRNNQVDIFMHAVELGDLYICKQVCEKQAMEFRLSFEEEFVHLLSHGFLHLCGFDHELNEREEKLMFDLEEKLLKAISKFKLGA